jgi:methyl-accepting chemotaxis protein
MKNLKISTRLAILVALMSALLAAIGGFGLWGISRSNEALRSVYEDRTIPTQQLSEMRRLMLRNRVAIDHAIISPSQKNLEESAAELEKNAAALAKIWSAYMATGLTPEEAKLARQFTDTYTKLDKDGFHPFVAMLREGDMGTARREVDALLVPLYEPAAELVDRLTKLQVDVAKAEDEDAVARYTTVRAASIGAIAFGVLFSAWFGFVLTRGISKSLAEAVEASDAVARGDLRREITANGRDEITQLLQSLGAMRANLSGIVMQVRRGTDTIATASAQIATGNQDLSQRTEEQASSLEETAASMEQLTGTVKQNAENARQANQLAQAASQVATKGGSVVGQVVDTMGSIQNASRKIADIISVIDGIAFQTNILALNAAVEAARAGEQGRGFAVVATEVRNLAQRSAAAAKEIKGLIDDSVGKVDAGSLLVGQAGGTMREVVDSIRRVTDIMGEIAAASEEQTRGIEQVNQAVTQMDQVTQQNAALVEEASAAAQSMREQADQLVQAVGVFQLKEDVEASRAIQRAKVAAQRALPASDSARPATPVVEQPPAARPRAAAAAAADWAQF